VRTGYLERQQLLFCIRKPNLGKPKKIYQKKISRINIFLRFSYFALFVLYPGTSVAGKEGVFAIDSLTPHATSCSAFSVPRTSIGVG
jgi:hypothetical protein